MVGGGVESAASAAELKGPWEGPGALMALRGYEASQIIHRNPSHSINSRSSIPDAFLCQAVS